ncbi:UNVERIFIED_CONTAM: hypothetical protein GTU68_016348 [Idotea baltica]|nr:hypothetical protein [Idotea baltica]
MYSYPQMATHITRAYSNRYWMEQYRICYRSRLRSKVT